MNTPVLIPKMGMSTVEVDLVAWHVKVGDRVVPGDELAEVESEKANYTIESELAGTVSEICVEAGETVDVGTTICIIDTDE